MARIDDFWKSCSSAIQKTNTLKNHQIIHKMKKSLFFFVSACSFMELIQRSLQFLLESAVNTFRILGSYLYDSHSHSDSGYHTRRQHFFVGRGDRTRHTALTLRTLTDQTIRRLNRYGQLDSRKALYIYSSINFSMTLLVSKPLLQYYCDIIAISVNI